MNIPNNLSKLLLGIYLVTIGLMGTFGLSLGQLGVLVPLLAVVTGVLILLGK